MRTAFAAALIVAGSAVFAACTALPEHEGGSGMPPTTDDQCRASEYRDLVGQNRSELPEAPAGATWRVTCTGCPVTMDHRPDRLNILFDQDTGVVEEVKCG